LGFAEPLRRRFRPPFEVAPARQRQVVMLLPGFATHPLRMRYMARKLEQAGHVVKRWGLGFNMGPTEQTLDQLEERLESIAWTHGRPVVLVGWSLGGIFARELAKRRPDLVAKVVSMGSPFSGTPYGNNVWRLYHLVTGHRVDSPPIEARLAEKPPVETVALWSPRDGMIDPRCAAGLPGERDRAVAVRCSHLGFSNSPEAITAVLAELQRV
jgi:pimeloyl-ACP methyl ester carboxylesterase